MSLGLASDDTELANCDAARWFLAKARRVGEVTHKSRLLSNHWLPRVRIAPVAQAICRRRHQPRRPTLAKIRPGSPAPAMGPGTVALQSAPTRRSVSDWRWPFVSQHTRVPT
jgi:hypothetical protein